MSTSRSDLEPLFQEKGIVSRFLNDSGRVYVGQLGSSARSELLKRLSFELQEYAQQHAAGFVFGLLRVSERLNAHGNPERAGDELANELQGVFSSWWARRSRSEQQILREATRGLPICRCRDDQRRCARALEQRGLVEERDALFVLPGSAWRAFVEHVA